MSLQAIAQHIREGAISKRVMGWAMDQLKAAGVDGRDGPPPYGNASNFKKASVLLDAIRSATVYTADPPGVELVKSAEAMLCLAPGLCIRGGDCFPEGTLLLRDDFELVPIEKIVPGDRIWGLNDWSTVTKTAFKGELPLDALTLNNGSTVHLTPDHKVYVGLCRHGKGVECLTCRIVDHCEQFKRIRVSALQVGEVLPRPDRLHSMFVSGHYEFVLGTHAERVGFLTLKSIDRHVRSALCWDISTSDQYVYLPEHDVTVSNCDDMCILLGSTCMSVGVPVRVIKQSFGLENQEHVLVEAQNDDGTWFPMDPSTNLPAGRKYPASQEWRMDPQNPSMIGLRGAPEAEFIGIGKAHVHEGKKPCKCAGKCKPCGGPGLGRLPPVGLGATTALPSFTAPTSGAYEQAATDLQNQMIAVIQAGDSYYGAGEYQQAISSYQAAGNAGATGIGPEIDLGPAPNLTQPLTQKAWLLNSALAAVPTTSNASSDADNASQLVVQMATYYEQAITTGNAAASAGTSDPIAGTNPILNMNLIQGTLYAGALGALIGLAYVHLHHVPTPVRIRRRRR
jgi:hypothetical protein